MSGPRARKARIGMALACSVCMAVTVLASAQSKKKGTGERRPHAEAPATNKGPGRTQGTQGKAHARKTAEGTQDEAGELDGGLERVSRAAGPSTPASGREGRDGGMAVEQRSADGGTKVFRFGEVEVEGRLKSPQLVYFLRRVRAEFAAGDLGHRSFFPELHETRHEPSFE